MKRKIVSGIMLTMLLISMLILTFNIQPVKASGTIYIRANGSVDPSTANITSADNVTYTFTGNINESIIVERDNIVVNGVGNTVQGPGDGAGIDLSGRSNVTIKNTEIKAFEVGIYLWISSNNTISGNNITNNEYGIGLDESSNYNNISGNTVTDNDYGIYLYESSNNRMFGNNITNNELYGTVFDYSSNNIISGNNMTANSGGWAGIGLWVGSENNRFYHNNFLDEVKFISMGTCGYVNFWDDGYPSGGNYWGGYTGVDFYSGPGQNEPGSDGIGDKPFFLDVSNCTIGNKDRYPLMGLFGPLTTEGENITVFPTDDVGLIFENVTTGGSTTVNKTETGPDPPSGFKLAEQYYDIETTANFSGNITIRIVYDDTNMTQEEEEALRLMQWDENLLQWIDITTHVDTENNIIYGETSHLSMFACMLAPPPIPGDVNGNGKVSITDLVIAALAFGSYPGHLNWNPQADLNNDDKVSIIDLVIIGINFGRRW